MQIRNEIENPAITATQTQQAVAPPASPESSSAGKVSPQNFAPALGSDQAKLSQASSQLALDPGTDVRTEKVAAIQAAIQAGTYQVPASAVAQKLIDSMLEPK
jgi:negative regulator of flagellin synthesis FlgM